MNSKYWQLHNGAVAADKFLNERSLRNYCQHMSKMFLFGWFVYMASSDPVDFFLL